MLNYIILYKYFLCYKSIKSADFKWAIEYHKKHRIPRGKFFCWHHWHLFEVIPSGHMEYGFAQTDVMCSKCGKVAQRRPEHIDDRLIDYNRHVTWT
jgi:hypothetical protein